MNFSRLRNRAYAYLGAYKTRIDEKTDALMSECFRELETLAHFRYVYKLCEEVPEFLEKSPYTEYLAGSKGVILCVMTLGGEADRRIKYYSRTDAEKSVVFDAAASAYVEELSDEYEESLGAELSYRFCPGYGGSDISDIRYIFDALKPEKIGLTLTETNYMLPSKSMAGIIAVGGNAKKSCGNCAVREYCAFGKEGGRCYDSEKK